MKKAFLKLASAATAFTLLCTQTMPLITASAEEEVPTSGQCGYKLNWEYADGTLTISGEGSNGIYETYKLQGTNGDTYPWHPFHEEINSVVFDENCGLIEIPSFAFYNYENLKSVTLSPKIRYMEPLAISRTAITEITIPENMTYIAPENFGFNGTGYDDCIIYGLSNSAASNYCFDTGCTFSSTDGVELQEVNVNADTWQFENTLVDFGEIAKVYNAFLTPEDFEAFKKNSTNTDFMCLKAMFNTWAGACLGMSSLLTLCHNGVLSPSDIQPGADTIHDIEMDVNVESILNYYSIMLNGYAIQNLSDVMADKYSEAERIESLLSYGQKAHDEETNFVVTVYAATAHALVGVDMITGQWNLGGNTYDTCVQMIDPNYRDQISAGSSIYVNTENGNWILPSMNAGNTTGLNKKSGFSCTDSESVLNYRGLINGVQDYDVNVPQYTAIQFLHFESEDTTLELTDANEDTLFSWSGVGRLVNEGVLYPPEETVTFHRTIGEDAFTLCSPHMKVIGPDYYFFTKANSTEYMTIAPDGISFTISEWAAKHHAGSEYNESFSFEPTLTFNAERFQDGFQWDTIRIEMKDSVVKDGAIKQAENGYILSGDMLKEVTVYLQQAKEDGYREIKLSTNEPSVFITCDENNNPILLADANRDGTYETLMDETFKEPELITYDIAFASYILNYYANASAGLDVSGWNTETCDVNGDGNIDIEDSAYVLRKYAENAAGLN